MPNAGNALDDLAAAVRDASDIKPGTRRDINHYCEGLAHVGLLGARDYHAAAASGEHGRNGSMERRVANIARLINGASRAIASRRPNVNAGPARTAAVNACRWLAFR